MKKEYQWHGKPVKVKFGNCIVRVNNEKPLWWYNYECRQDGLACIAAVQVTTMDGYQFVIANHFGIGIHKLENGGWPNYSHFSLDGEFSTKPRLKYDVFDIEGFVNYEQERRKWEQENYPELFAQHEELKKMITKPNNP